MTPARMVGGIDSVEGDSLVFDAVGRFVALSSSDGGDLVALAEIFPG